MVTGGRVALDTYAHLLDEGVGEALDLDGELSGSPGAGNPVEQATIAGDPVLAA